ncbi:MAG: ATP-binding protein [Candidatus Obscuribacterales bacterium]|nr:ATP-binding protein [Candidatus Obscuribacterales bacterium]
MLLEASRVSRVILLNGARQTGKSTLLQGLFEGADEPVYVSLDDLSSLDAAKRTPKSFLQQFNGPVIIDEIQRAPELFLPMKEIVDQDKSPGRFFLSGSASVLGLPKLADSLAGRMDIHSLWTLSQGEMNGYHELFVDSAFQKEKIKRVKGVKLGALLQKIVAGGYPEVLMRPTETARTIWYESYLKTILERDVRDLSNIEGITMLPNLLALIASRAGNLVNTSDLSRSLTIPNTSLKRYLSLLQAVFLTVPIQPWFGNIGKRIVKSPKVFLNDTGLLCHLLGQNVDSLMGANHTLLGPVFENFVMMELCKQISWSKTRPKLYHYRTSTGEEVDFVLESRDGRLVGIECKTSASVDHNSFKGLRSLEAALGAKLHRGIVIYTGSETLAFGDKFDAVPVNAIWETTSNAPS